jgi:hypothetical protein
MSLLNGAFRFLPTASYISLTALRRVVEVREQIETLQNELSTILGNGNGA